MLHVLNVAIFVVAFDFMISPPVISVTASIDVVPGRPGRWRKFRVRCTSSGGRPLNMSVTGRRGLSADLINIQAVGTPQRMGSDSFSDTTNSILGEHDRQLYECTASNGVSSDPTGSIELRGDGMTCLTKIQNTFSLLNIKFVECGGIIILCIYAVTNIAGVHNLLCSCISSNHNITRHDIIYLNQSDMESTITRSPSDWLCSTLRN